MEYDNSWKKNDTTTPEYKRQVVFFTVITFFAATVAASMLAYKIDGAEKAQLEKAQSAKHIAQSANERTTPEK